jgi:ribosomal protein S11
MSEDKNIKSEEGNVKEADKTAVGLGLEKKEESIQDKKKKIKKIKKQITKGRASIKCTYNNTMVSIADGSGNTLAWSTSGLLGFKGAKKATPYAATQVVGTVSEKIRKYGIKELEV